MNLADGASVPVVNESPIGDAAGQYSPPCDDATGLPIIRNVTKQSFPGMNATDASEAELLDYKAPEVSATPAENFVDLFIPSSIGTAKEEDLMNGVISHHSSLMSKGNDIAALRPEANDPPRPPTSQEMHETTFKPREGSRRDKNNMLQPEEVISSSTTEYTVTAMEAGVELPANNLASNSAPSFEPVDRTQKAAMSNSKFQSTSILNPPVTPPATFTAENVHDLTGQEQPHEPQMHVRDNEEVVEGWDIKSVPVETAQTAVGNEGKVVGPEPEIDTVKEVAQFDAKQDSILATKNKELEDMAMEQGIELPPKSEDTKVLDKIQSEDAIAKAIAVIEQETGKPIQDITTNLSDAETGTSVAPLTAA